MKHLFFCIALGFIFLLSSCASSKELAQEKFSEPEQLSKTIIKSFNIAPSVLEKAQFFSGDSIVLQREYSVGNSSVGSDGTIFLTGGKPVDQIVINLNTPGIIKKEGIVFNEEKAIKFVKINFTNDPNLFLIFGPDETEPGNFVLFTKEDDTILYGGLEYKVVNGLGAPLLFSYMLLEKQNKKRTEGGALIGQQVQKRSKNTKREKE